MKSHQVFELQIEGSLDGFLFVCLKRDRGEVIKTLEVETTPPLTRCQFTMNEIGLFYVSISDECHRVLDKNGLWQERWSEDCDFQLLVYDDTYRAPDGLWGGIGYQIFPDRYYTAGKAKRFTGRTYHENLSDTPIWWPDENGIVQNTDFYGGNLAGITEKLPYLQSLGITMLYLNPIFKARSNHRYDTADYFTIDPQLGTEEDFVNLCAKAKEAGIRVILDGVFSHTGDDSIYFNRYGNFESLGAYQSQESPYYSWYRFQQWPFRYSSWWGIETLPELDESNPDYVEFITGEEGVIAYWMSRGASGFRLDVADELPDSFIEKIRARIKQIDPNGLLIGEVWEDASNKISYDCRRRYFYGSELDGTINYPFRNAILEFLAHPDADAFLAQVMTIILHYPTPMLNCCWNILSSHDTFRAINQLVVDPSEVPTKREQAARVLSKDEYYRGVELLKLAFDVLYMLPGIPMLYYGDEIGMQGFGDPFCRMYFNWEHPDRQVLSYVQELGKKRKQWKAYLVDGRFSVSALSKEVLAFSRTLPDGRELTLLVNRGQDVLEWKGKDTTSYTVAPWRSMWIEN